MCDRVIPYFRWIFFLSVSITGWLIAWPSPVYAGDNLRQVVSVSPAWHTFTNQDGTGLYHEILSAVFTARGITVAHQYTNATRGLHMVQKGLADVYTCRPEVDDFPDLMLAAYPMYEGQFHAFFKKSRIADWHGESSLAGRKVVWRRGYYKASEFTVAITVLEADTGDSALTQVVLGRGDVYIDDINLIRESLSRMQSGAVSMDDYRIEPVGRRSYYPVLKRSARGAAIMSVYDTGIERLHRSGELRKIFEKWHHPYPVYEIR